jgi:hypothetical protein
MAESGYVNYSKGEGSGIEEMMRQLGIAEEDLDDVVFEEEGPPLEEARCWLAIAIGFSPKAPTLASGFQEHEISMGSCARSEDEVS